MATTKHWSKMQERGTYLGMKTLLFCYRILGRTGLSIILYPVIVYLYFTGGESKKASLNYLGKIAKRKGSSKQPGHREGIKHFYTFAQGAFDKIDAWTGKITIDQVQYSYDEKFKKLLEDNKGAVFIGSHLGNLEVCRTLSVGKYKTRINVLVFTHHAIEFNKIMQKINPNVNVNFIQVSDVGVDLAILLKQRVEAGEKVVIVGDRTSTTSPGRVVYADFLGQQAPFSQGPFILASLLECPVYYLFCLKDGNKYHLIFEHVSDKLKFARKTRQADIGELINQYAQRLEHFCLQYPYQWFNFFDFWQEDHKVERKK
ncbi:putative acyltransferase [Moritella sp. PE36]|uniref:LpxL/LpxP family acyltransferase n=1 Tax=Moritella sp. PE36 TaxID=58051 RepID=UPI0001568588|nr:acyltransferase [Moritella sp. PE36]EDM68725.1 putative acyltransferase [Moritella sp. PE36]